MTRTTVWPALAAVTFDTTVKPLRPARQIEVRITNSSRQKLAP